MAHECLLSSVIVRGGACSPCLNLHVLCSVQLSEALRMPRPAAFVSVQPSDGQPTPPGTPQHHDAIHVCSFNSEILKLVCSPVACVKLDSHASIGANYDKLKGKCAFGPFLSILVIECKHKCLNVKICPRMIKVQITS
jgi:hypothetical protein